MRHEKADLLRRRGSVVYVDIEHEDNRVMVVDMAIGRGRMVLFIIFLKTMDTLVCHEILVIASIWPRHSPSPFPLSKRGVGRVRRGSLDSASFVFLATPSVSLRLHSAKKTAKKVIQKDSAKKTAKKSRVKVSVRMVNYQHIMPTHYTLDVNLKDVITLVVMQSKDKKVTVAKEAKARFE
ncbi:hypothetical protein Scep_030189 [Stephania cephalantha]|uniref:60S ribosomal protein L27 n=1 Tax=Stephania cephalantha TaxID=152367 RepID=A0AAP0E2E4_9MAGN